MGSHHNTATIRPGRGGNAGVCEKSVRRKREKILVTTSRILSRTVLSHLVIYKPIHVTEHTYAVSVLCVLFFFFCIFCF